MVSDLSLDIKMRLRVVRPFCFSTMGRNFDNVWKYSKNTKKTVGVPELYHVSNAMCVRAPALGAFSIRCVTAKAHTPIGSFSHLLSKMPIYPKEFPYTLSHLENDRDAACHRSRNLCVFSHVQKGTPRLTHKGCVLQRVFLDTIISDVTVVFGMRQSIGGKTKWRLLHVKR